MLKDINSGKIIVISAVFLAALKRNIVEVEGNKINKKTKKFREDFEIFLMFREDFESFRI